MKIRPAYQIIQQVKMLFGDHSLAFGPVVEPKSEEAFVDENPWDLLRSGRINDVPWINSYTKNEIIFLLSGKYERNSSFLTGVATLSIGGELINYLL